MKWRIYKESNEEVDIKKLLKLNGVTKLPVGTKFPGTKASWEKHKGYAGQKTIRNMCIQLEHAGWKKGDWTTGGNPDGSSVANSNSYTSPDGRILMSYTEYYGCTSYDNSFYITFKLAEGPMNESDEWADWNNAEPMIYKYYADDPTPMDEFVDCVRTKEQELEDIIIQNSETYSSLPYEEAWNLFCDDICNGNSPEQELELDYYMNKTAKTKLPNDIKKYVVGDGFDAVEFMHDIFNRVISVSKDLVDESTIKGVGRVDFDDDLVAVYTPDGEVEYKGIFDDCPYKDDDMRYDKTTMTYRIEGPNGDYRTMAKLAESCRESSRFGFNVGDDVELKDDVEPNRFGGRDAVPAGTIGEVVAIDKPMRGVIKVKIEDGTVVSVPERKLKFAGTDNEPWEKYKVPAKPKPTLDEILAKHGPEEIYNEPPRPGYPKWTGN